MIIYNVTVAIDAAKEAEWLQWMQKTHIPEMLQTGCFTQARMHKVLHSADENGHPSYAVQYHLHNRSLLETYYQQYADKLRDRAFAAFGNQFIAVRTELEEVFVSTP